MEFVGRKVRVDLTDNSVNEGYVHSLDATLGKLTLEKVVCIDENGEKTKFGGLLNIFNREITSIVAAEEVIKPRNKEEKVVGRRGKGDHCIMKPKWCNPHLDRLGTLNPKALTLKNTNAEDGMTSSGGEAGSSETEEDVISHPEYTVIGKLNSVFHDAIKYISKHLVISVAMEGVSLGRNGKLCWVQIAVPDHVLVFDILRLGQGAFDEGLSFILEAESILKVFHDCRMVSDIMFHQYDIKLVNVFDTQVASAFVYRLQHHNDWPRHVHGLASCLIEHLNLPEHQVNWAVVREGFRESDEEVWMQRPAKRKHLEALVKNVIHLLDLRQVLMEKMMEEYVAGVNIYLTQVRDASNGDIEKYQRMSYLLPSAFQDIKHFMRSYHRRNPLTRLEDETKDSNGFRENYSKISHPNVIFSRDSLWHTGSVVKQNSDTETGSKKLQRYATQMSHLMPNYEKERQQSLSAESDVPTLTQTSAPAPRESPSLSPPTQSSTYVPHQGNFCSTSASQDEDLDHGSGLASKINIEKRIRSPTSSTHGYFSDRDYKPVSKPVDNTVVQSDEGCKESKEDQLSGGSLMRALINQQAPPGAEDNSNLDNMNLMPAGKLIPSCGKKKSLPIMYQLDRTLHRPGVKRLTEQEMEVVSKMGHQNGNRYGSGTLQNDVTKPQGMPIANNDYQTANRNYPSEQRDYSAVNRNTVTRRGEHSGYQFGNTQEKYNQQSGETTPPSVHQYLPWQSRSGRTDTPNIPSFYQMQLQKQQDANSGLKSQNTQLSNQSSSSEDERLSIPPAKSAGNSTSPVSARLQALMLAMNT